MQNKNKIVDILLKLVYEQLIKIVNTKLMYIERNDVIQNLKKREGEINVSFFSLSQDLLLSYF